MQTSGGLRDVRLEVSIFFFAIACGGSVIGPIDEAGTDAVSTTDGTTGVDGGATDCKLLVLQLQTERDKLQKCCPTCKSLQCMGSVPDVCCPITTNGGDTTTFSSLVNAYKSQCHPLCPGAPCLPVPSGICDSVNMDPQVGRCR